MTTSSVYLVSLGCAKNLVDSEIMLGSLLKANYPIENSPSAAEIIIINTCAFIQPAKEEALETIIELGRQKKHGACRLLVVTGCLPQRYRSSLSALLPEVDIFIGTGEFHRIVEIINAHLQTEATPHFYLKNTRYLYDDTTPRLNTSLPGTAYVKIAEGCAHRCSFCIIPKVRGGFRSRDPRSVVREVENLSKQGIKEINLVAQDTTMFGRELSPPFGITALLRHLGRIKGIEWIRLLYANPQRLTNELLQVIEEGKKICKYLDLPLQHVNPEILRAMNRANDPERIKDLVERIRTRIPRVTIRTALMVGFPGETDAQFGELLAFVRQVEFDRLGVFTYSAEEGTAAARLPHQIPEKVKEDRRNTIMEAQAGISRKKNRALIGTVQEVLLQTRDQSGSRGRTSAQAPDVDGVVKVTAHNALRLGKLYPVVITDADAYDLHGIIFRQGKSSKNL